MALVDAGPVTSDGSSTQLTTYPQFTPEDLDYLRERGIPPDLAAAAGLRGVTSEEATQALGRAKPVGSAGLLIPYPGVTPPYVRIRFHEVEAAGARYLTLPGREVPLYAVKPECRSDDAMTPVPPGLGNVLFVVESPIKALALTAVGLQAVGLSGTATTLEEKHGVRRLNSTWPRTDLVGRNVTLVFDAGRATNPAVARDEARLARALTEAGAKVSVAALPLKPVVDDQGPDDFITAQGAQAFYTLLGEAVPAGPQDRVAAHVAASKAAIDLLDDLPFLHSILEASDGTSAKARDALTKAGVAKKDLAAALKRAKARAALSSNDEDERAVGAEYSVLDGRITKALGGGVPLCNFDARIVEERVHDDGQEKERKFVIAGKLDNGTPLQRVELEPADLADPLWAMKAWGTAARVASRKGVTDELRLALQSLSNPQVHTAYSHTGWGKLADATGVESGDPVFLTANGAIGASDISVELGDRLALYSLPSAPEDVAEAVRVSLRLLELGPRQVMLTLLALTYRAPLQSLLPADFSCFLEGKSGSLKTTVSKLAAAHFGVGLAEHPVTSFEASVSSIEDVLHRLKDVLALVDDFKPASQFAKDEHQCRARQVFSSVGNLEGRGRMRADGSTRRARAPRALVVATGETLPAGESTVARLLPLALRKEMITMPKLTAAQGNVEALPHAMAAYLHYLRPRYESLRKELKAKHAALRERFRKVSEGAHLRSPSALAHAALGLGALWPFAVSVGAITNAQARELEQESLRELDRLCSDAAGLARESDPALRFLEYLRAGISQGNFVLHNNTAEPLDAARAASTLRGEWVGWFDKSKRYYYLLPEPTYVAVTRAMGPGESMPLSERALWRRLRDLGLIEKSDRADRLGKRVELGGERLDVIWVKKIVLFPDEGPGGTDGGGEDGGGGGGIGGNGRDACERGGGEGAAGSLPPARSAGPASTTGALGYAADCTNQAPNGTKHGANCTGAAGPDGDSGMTQPTGIKAASILVGGSPGPVGTVGTVESEEKKRGETTFAAKERGEGSPLPSTPLPPRTAPTVPTGPAPLTNCMQVGSPVGPAPAPSSQLYPVDERAFVADGLALLRRHPAQPRPLFCLKTAKQLLGEGAVGPDDYRRAGELQEKLASAGLAGTAELEFDLIPVIAGMERAGIGIDVAAWTELVCSAEAEIAAQRAGLAAQGLQKPTNDAHVLAALATRGIITNSSSWKALVAHMDDPLVAALVAYRRAQAFLDSLGRAVLESVTRGDGRVHPRFDPLAAPTGRMSCSKPNMLAIPKAPVYRRCVVPAAGHLLVVADYSAIELRVLAETTRDEALTRVFADGGDPHAATAAALVAKTVGAVTREERQRAKAVNFGFAFGMGPKKFMEYAQANYSIAFTLEEARAAREAFLAAYPGVRTWQEQVRTETPSEVRTVGGRRRVFLSAKDGYCERLNSPVQGTAADGLKLAMVLLAQRLPGHGARLVLAVHDELLIEAPADRAHVVRDLVEETMVEGMARFVSSVPIRVAGSVRRNWAEVEVE